MDMKRKTTRLVPLFRGKRLPVALFTMALASANMAFAQDNPWVGEALPTESGEYYLYNTKGDGFLLGSNSWGTQGSLGQPGLLCTVAVSNGKYKIVTKANSDTNGLGDNGFVDNASPAEFSFVDPTPDDGVSEFVIALANKTFYWGGTGTVLTLDENGDASEAQWMLVSKEQREKKLDEATAENGQDATFYVVGAGFERAQPSAWKETHDGGSLSLSSPGGGANVNFYCAEASDNKSFDIYQELKGLRNGRYRLTCQGFYTAEGEVQNVMLYAGMNEMPVMAGVDDGEGLPGNANDAAKAFEDGRFAGNAVEAIVTDGTLRFGVKKLRRVAGDKSFFDNFRLTYLGVAEMSEAFNDALSALNNLQQEFAEGGATAAAAELKAVYDQYASTSGDYETAMAAVAETISKANAVRAAVGALSTAVSDADAYWARVESGEIVLCASAKAVLQQAIETAKGLLADTKMEAMGDGAVEAAANLDTAVGNAKTWVALSYPLTVAKALADKIGGLEATEEYKKVVADLDVAELTYDDMMLDVTALDALCQGKLTPEFLGGVSQDNPLDLTSFIANPNIYQNGEKSQMPGGWILGMNNAKDNHEFSTVAHGDAELQAGNWSGNKGNDVTGIHYYQKIGVDGEGTVKLPDGLYELRAATYANTDNKKIVLYATSDSVNFDTVYFNRDRVAYDAALSEMGTTSAVKDIVVAGGQLYIGARGADPENNWQGGNGKSWNADNFRLYFMGTDVLAAYRERLKDKLDEGTVLHDSLMTYGINDDDYLGMALAEDGYGIFLEEGSVDEVKDAIEQMDEMNVGAKKVIDNYLLLNPVVVNGANFKDQLDEGLLFAQPSAKEKFIAALEEAAVVAEEMTWDNYASEKVVEQAEALKAATTEFMNSVGLCYSMGTAKVLADQIGGLSETEAYRNVVAFLSSDDELDPLDVDLAVQALQGECVNAMTPEVLGRATVENPFNMTTFVVNPNIFQDAVDDDDNPLNTRINGWTCETSADDGGRTNSNQGDTWLNCYSWSGNESHNIASATNYRQVVGTQIGEEGKFMLPVGAYRLEAATFADSQPDRLDLYAQTNDVTESTVTGSAGQDSTVYTYTEIESVTSTFNGSRDLWDNAQASLGTMTIIPEIFVDKGAVAIGVRGNGVVGGNGHYWYADNFRLYYVGTKKGDHIGGAIVDGGNEPEYVDVYDITGKLVRKQVKRADALKGLKNGIYIAGGRKYVVAGN